MFHIKSYRLELPGRGAKDNVVIFFGAAAVSHADKVSPSKPQTLGMLRQLEHGTASIQIASFAVVDYCAKIMSIHNIAHGRW